MSYDNDFLSLEEDIEEDFPIAQTKKEWELECFQIKSLEDNNLIELEELNNSAIEEAIIQLIKNHPIEFERNLLQSRINCGIEKVYETEISPYIKKIWKDEYGDQNYI